MSVGCLGAALLAIAAAACGRPPPPAEPAPLRIAVPYELQTLDPYRENTLSNDSTLPYLCEAAAGTDGKLRVRGVYGSRRVHLHCSST